MVTWRWRKTVENVKSAPRCSTQPPHPPPPLQCLFSVRFGQFSFLYDFYFKSVLSCLKSADVRRLDQSSISKVSRSLSTFMFTPTLWRAAQARLRLTTGDLTVFSLSFPLSLPLSLSLSLFGNNCLCLCLCLFLFLCLWLCLCYCHCIWHLQGILFELCATALHFLFWITIVTTSSFSPLCCAFTSRL